MLKFVLYFSRHWVSAAVWLLLGPLRGRGVTLSQREVAVPLTALHATVTVMKTGQGPRRWRRRRFRSHSEGGACTMRGHRLQRRCWELHQLCVVNPVTWISPQAPVTAGTGTISLKRLLGWRELHLIHCFIFCHLFHSSSILCSPTKCFHYSVITEWFSSTSSKALHKQTDLCDLSDETDLRDGACIQPSLLLSGHWIIPRSLIWVMSYVGIHKAPVTSVQTPDLTLMWAQILVFSF